MDIKGFFDKLDLDEINRFIEEEISESLFLEFKTANYPNKGIEYDKKNFSKCLSGFSNSGGGIIIWGIVAKERKNKPDVAVELKPIKKLIEFESYLKKNEGNAVVPMISGIEYRRIYDKNNGGYLAVYVPVSDRVPHMALFSDKRYYKRSGDSFYICEHYDIIDMINRMKSPDLVVKIEKINIKTDKYQNYKDYNIVEATITIENIGIISAKHVMLEIFIEAPYSISKYGIYLNDVTGMKILKTNHHKAQYHAGSDLIIHPKTSQSIDNLVINETGYNYQEIDDLILEYSLVAEGMSLKKGVITIPKKDIIKRPTD